MEIRNKFELKGKVALVTGSSRGIGKAIAAGLAAYGAEVVISSRDEESVNLVVEEFKANGWNATGMVCHVGKMEDMSSLIQKIEGQFGRLDILVNNAAINPTFGAINDVTGDLFDKINSVNVKAPLLLSNLVFPLMKKNGGGSIMHVSSVEGEKPGNGTGLYSLTKASLTMLAKVQAKEWGRHNIRVNAILPGLYKTKFSSALWKNEGLMKILNKVLPLGRMAMPEEIAGLGVFLASDASSYCTGSSFTADGGYLISG